MTDMTDNITIDTHTSVGQQRRWTVLMVLAAILDGLVQVSFSGTYFQYIGSDLGFAWCVIASLTALAAPFMLIWRDRYPERLCLAAVLICLALPLGAVLPLLTLSALFARCNKRSTLCLYTILTAITAGKVEILDLLRPADFSIWRILFAEPGTGSNGIPAVVNIDIRVIALVATIWNIVTIVVAIMMGIHIRSQAIAVNANAQIDAERTRANQLEYSLSNQRLADAIAAEAHDTLAHSLSLIAVNASALQSEAQRLSMSIHALLEDPNDHNDQTSQQRQLSMDVDKLAERASDIRRQAAGALDEAHSIIDMLRHPQDAIDLLAPSSDTALTREALTKVLNDAREAGMSLDTWIDIQNLSALDPEIGKVAFRGIQEGLTNARRHAPEARVSLEITVAPKTGVIIRFANAITHAISQSEVSPERAAVGILHPANIQNSHIQPHQTEPPSAAPRSHGGQGLPGLKERATQVGGDCQYGYDQRNNFHLDLRLPFTPIRLNHA